MTARQICKELGERVVSDPVLRQDAGGKPHFAESGCPVAAI